MSQQWRCRCPGTGSCCHGPLLPAQAPGLKVSHAQVWGLGYRVQPSEYGCAADRQRQPGVSDTEAFTGDAGLQTGLCKQASTRWQAVCAQEAARDLHSHLHKPRQASQETMRGARAHLKGQQPRAGQAGSVPQALWPLQGLRARMPAGCGWGPSVWRLPRQTQPPALLIKVAMAVRLRMLQLRVGSAHD